MYNFVPCIKQIKTKNKGQDKKDDQGYTHWAFYPEKPVKLVSQFFKCFKKGI
jgi:hypothetical protein